MKILITGGSSGLGRSITACLAAAYPEGLIYFTYNASRAAAQEIERQFPNTRALHLDFSNEKSVSGLSGEMPELKIDVLINNAVTSLEKNHFHKTDTQLFLRSFTENVFPVIKITSAFISMARARKSGKIITVLSAAIGGTPLTGWAEYTANKNYLLSMVKSWAAENVQFNIQSNGVSPEFMDTPLNASLDSRLKDEMIKSHPLKKLLTTEEVADTIKFLVAGSAHITGQNIFLNNGKS